MNIQAQLADGTVLDFPEGTDQAVIDRVVKQHISGGAQQPSADGWKDMAIPYDMAAPGAQNVDYGDTYGPGVSYLRSVGQGAMLGFGDEIGGALKGYVPALLNGKDPQAEYARVRDNFRRQSEMEAAKNPAATTAGNITGQVATGVGATLATGGATLPAMLGIGAVQGGLTGLGESEATSAGDMAVDTLQGGAIGAGGALVGAGVGKVVKSVIAPAVSDSVKLLMGKGVTPTPGQILGPTAAKLEDRLTSIPLLGNAVSGAQTRALDQFNKAALNQAAGKIGGQVDEVGRPGIEALKNQFDAAYTTILPKLTFQADNVLMQDLGKITSMVGQMPKPQAQRFAQIVKDKVSARLGANGVMDGKTFKGIEEELGDMAKGYMSSASFDERQLGAAIREVLTSMKANLARSNPTLAPELQAINQGYAQYAILRDAASRIGTEAGVFTPAQLQSAVRAADKSAGKGRFATGNALMQDLSEAGKTVLGAKYPDSGTAGRGIIPALTMGAAGMTDLGMTAGSLGLASIPYSKLGQQAIAALLTKRPQGAEKLASLLGMTTPALGTGGALGLLGLGAP